MDMSFMFLIAMGLLTFVLVAGLFQTVSVLVTQRAKDKRSAQK